MKNYTKNHMFSVCFNREIDFRYTFNAATGNYEIKAFCGSNIHNL